MGGFKFEFDFRFKFAPKLQLQRHEQNLPQSKLLPRTMCECGSTYALCRAPSHESASRSVVLDS